MRQQRRGKQPPQQGVGNQYRTADDKRPLPGQCVHQPAESRITAGDTDQRSGSDHSVCRGATVNAHLVGYNVCGTRMQGGVAQSGQTANHQQADQEDLRRSADPAQHAGEDNEGAHRQAKQGQCPGRADAVDQPASGQHADRVDDQKGRVDPPHLRFADPQLRDEHLVAGDRNADAVKMSDRGETHYQRDDSPSVAGHAPISSSSLLLVGSTAVPWMSTVAPGKSTPDELDRYNLICSMVD